MAGDLFTSMTISASGMSAQRKRMEAIAKNIANADTVRSDDGQAYRRKRVVITGTESPKGERKRAAVPRMCLTQTSPMHIGGGAQGLSRKPAVPVVDAQEVVDENAKTTLVFDPHHPEAGKDGYVRIPEINTVIEMVDMASATKAYEANLAAMKAYQSMFKKSLEI